MAGLPKNSAIGPPLLGAGGVDIICAGFAIPAMDVHGIAKLHVL